MGVVDHALDRFGRWLSRVVDKPSSGYEPFTPSDPDTLRRILRPADVILVEGNQKIGAAIKYLTQSTWSHAALYAGDALGLRAPDGEPLTLIEMNLGEGCVAAPLSKYRTYNTRICRATSLSDEERAQVVAFMASHLGDMYDTRHIFDLARYLFPTPPVPVRWRRRMLALGSGEPTRAICSTLIAKAFHSVRYPILPRIEKVACETCAESDFQRREILHIRHHSLFAPRDFDISPYFQIVKPTVERGFDHKAVQWGEGPPGEGGVGRGRPVFERTRKGRRGA